MRTKITKTLSIALAILMIAALFTSFGIQASAASSYSATRTRRITVYTGSSWTSPSMTFKCTADYYCGSSKAPKLSLQVYNHNTGRTTWARVTGNGRTISSTLRLEKNTRYTVTVSYLYNASINKNALQAGGGYGWTQGTWSVSSTRNIRSYSIR